ncbi:MAG: alkaline phosphatase family protein [Alphaproteobacteria bacterium]
MQRTKVLLISVDSAELDLVLRWSDSGFLPALRSLRDDGAWSFVSSTPGLGNHAMWPTFYTGVSPARHGRFYDIQVEPGGYQDVQIGVEEVKREPFWNVISRAGRKVAIINVPKAPLSRDLNGFQLADWGTHDFEHPTVCSWPPDLAAEVTARYGADTIGICDVPDRQPEDYAAFRDALVARTERLARFAEDTLAQGGWDLFLVVFGDSHCVGHQCWHIHDPTHPRHDAALAGRVGDPLRDVYAAIDAAVARLLERAGPEATRIVFVGSGMEANYTGDLVLDPILRNLETAPRDPGTKLLGGAKWAWGKIPDAVKRRLRRPIEHIIQAAKASDRMGRASFAMPNHSGYGAIRVNVIGREAMGRVHPGPEFEAYCDALAADLMDIVNLETDERLVRRILRPADLYKGEYLDFLPDLLVEWNRAAPITSVGSPKIGKIRRPYRGHRTGDHTPHCIFFARAPGVAPGQLEGPVSVMDFAPTAAHLLGVSLGDVDGRPIGALG